MTPGRKVLVATAIAAVMGGGIVYVVNQQAVPAPLGYWNSGGFGCLPCSTQSPYTPSACPDEDPATDKTYYLRYDASLMEAAPWIWEGVTRMIEQINKVDGLMIAAPVKPAGLSALAALLDEAIYVGQGGSAHTVQYLIMLDLGGQSLGWIIPLGSQKQGGGWIMAPAPYRNMPLRGRAGETLCDEYRSMGGTATCPSGVTVPTYANQMKVFGEWSLAWPIVNQQKRTPQCSGPQPTLTATKAATPALTPIPPTPVPTAPPATSSTYKDWVYQFAAEGYSSGCGGGKFCPTRPVTREEIAVFILKAVHGPSYVPPPCTPPGTFSDVPCQ